MGILADYQIRNHIGITPFSEGIKRDNTISYGLSSYGVDARIGYFFRVFSPVQSKEIDPKNFDSKALINVDLTPDGIEKPNYILIPPHSFALGETVETFTIPRDILCVVLGKSSYARCGLIVNCTPLEPEWTGKVTLELSNTTPLPLRVYVNEGICQCIFFRTDGHSEAILQAVMRLSSRNGKDGVMPIETINELLHKELANGTCRVSYADKKGRYQNQTGLTLPSVDRK